MRKLIRPSLDSPLGIAPTARARRPVPPDATSAEATYLRQAVQARSELVVHLLGGAEMRGRLLAYDRDCLTVQPSGEAAVLVRKSQIRCYWAERVSRSREGA